MMCQRVCATGGSQKVGKISPSGPEWVDDTNVTQCKSCGFVFSFIIRKHHCRMCGHVFCRYCAAETWPLPKFEYLSPVRVCRKCARLCWKAEALVQAIQANDVNSLIKYVQRKNDCNLHIAVFPPLTVAAGGGFSEVCRVLISGGAKVEHAVPEPRTSIYVQCSFCLKMAAHTPNRANTYECSMCHELTTVKDGDKGGAAQDPTDHIGLTALHAAVKVQGHVDVVNALIQHNAPVDAKTARGNTPLLFAAGGGHVDCAIILIRHGANVNAQNADGDAPLHRAVKEGHVKMVNLLLDKGADKTVKNKAGQTPVQIADRSKKMDVVNALAHHQGPQIKEEHASQENPPDGSHSVNPNQGPTPTADE
uniref:FYVE-type domain-containing protein n=1 Tax=Hanusia phi TaxID=3032 RepID=A0A7S0NDK9_9CRYP|mmetsp:Transcript_7398/g.16867  ORF Transcript_7398/g.16867 Transcript_7398/m.16867 type:complete len:364 (+) Transcript_7398:151-1242(+)